MSRIITPDDGTEGIPAFTRPASDEQVKRVIGGVERRTLEPPPGVMMQRIQHPVSKNPAWAAIILPSEYRARGWVFFDVAIMEGDIQFAQTERALLIKRAGEHMGTFMTHRQSWIFGTDDMGNKFQTDELRKMKNACLMEIVANSGYTPKEYASAKRSLAAAMDKALHNMSFWDTDIAAKQSRKKWEKGRHLEQVGEHLADDGYVLHRSEDVI